MTPPYLIANNLSNGSVSHGFFSRVGGVSEGEYASLNVGVGSNDNPSHVLENRNRCARAMGTHGDRLLTAYQIHSPDVLVVDGPFRGPRPKADGMVTTTPGIALGVLSADCMPFVFCDPSAGVIGAAHAGWRGALGRDGRGVIENTIAKMASLGAKPERIAAALGPCLRQSNFEVGLDLVEAFTEQHPSSAQFFAPGARPEKRQFDLAGFGRWRLSSVGVENFFDTNTCTLGESERYFSYRAMKRAGGNDYGRNLSVIALNM